MLKITYNDIASLINKSEASIKGYKQSQPELLELLQLGARAKLNNISEKELELFANLKMQLQSKIEEKN